MTEPYLCRGEDDFTSEMQDHGEAVWQARLSTGETITMDDGRPGVSPRSAWLRLGDYCWSNKVSVTDLWLKFRSNVARNILPKNADAYFFAKSVLAMLNSNATLGFYIVGALKDDVLTVQRWSVPELVYIESEQRDPMLSGECLIRSWDGTTSTKEIRPAEAGLGLTPG